MTPGLPFGTVTSDPPAVPAGATTGQISLSNPNGNTDTGTFTVRAGVMTPKVGAVHLISVAPGAYATLLLTGLNIGSATSITLNNTELAFIAQKADRVLIIVPIVDQNISATINALKVSNGVSRSTNTKKMKVLGWH